MVTNAGKPVCKRGIVQAAGAMLLVMAMLVGLGSGDLAAEENGPRQPGTFRIGILAEPGANASIQSLDDLKRAYSAALGVPVEFFVADDYMALAEAQAERRIDYAVYSALAYAAAELSCACISPLVAPTGTNGALGMRAALIARVEGPASVADLPRFRTAMTGEEDIAGHQLPLLALGGEGIRLRGDEPFLVHAGSQDEAAARLLAGDVDAMFGWIETGIDSTPLPGVGTLERLGRAEEGSASFRVIWVSELLRFGPHAIRTDLDADFGARLRALLGGLKASEPRLFAALSRYRQGGFVSVAEGDYRVARDLVTFIASGE